MNDRVEIEMQYTNDDRHYIKERLVDGRVVEKLVHKTNDVGQHIKEHTLDGQVE